MPSPEPLKTQEDLVPEAPIEITPKEFFEIARVGTGCNFNERAFIDFLKAHNTDKRGIKVARQALSYIQESTSYTPSELASLDQTNQNLYRRARYKIRARLLKTIPFLQKYNPENRESGLREAALEADAYLKKLIGYYFPGEDSVEIHRKVKECNEGADLALMAFDDNTDPRIKFEAARKLLLMKYIREIRDYSKKDEDHNKALLYINNLFDGKIIELPEGSKTGETIPKYLVSEHAPTTKATIETKILDTKPEDLESEGLTRVTRLAGNKTTVIDKEGKEREIFFVLIPREKENESRLIKALRYGSKVGEKDVDRNGVRLLFEKREDWDDFFPMLIEEIKNEIRDDLCERLEDEPAPKEESKMLTRLNNLSADPFDEDDENPHKSIQITELKDSLDGKGFNGNANSSSKDFKVFKFKMRITRGDGRKHFYEFQVFLPDGFADDKYRKGVSWEEYAADRFFREGVDQLLFPEHIYGEIDRKKAHQAVLQRAHETVWPKKPGIVEQARSLLTSCRNKTRSILSRLPWNQVN